VFLMCDQMPGFENNSREIDLSTMSSPIEMPVVPIVLNGVELGVELSSHPLGARVVGVAAEAQAAGLQAGDVIVAVDEIPVAGFRHQSVYELGFKIPPGHEVTWTVERDGRRIELRAKAPGQVAAPLYMY
jgi:S1-C subfamily serine protease